MKHIPVLLSETIDGLGLGDFNAKKVVVDATLGLGGHASQVIERLGSEDVFIGFDAFQANFDETSKRLSAENEHIQKHFFHANFRELNASLRSAGIHEITHLYADLGVSSVHFDDSESSFSFRGEAPLDMRLDPRTGGVTAADFIASESFERLAEVFRKYGDEKNAGRIARAIVQDREAEPFETTTQLAGLIERVTHSMKSVARCFQALRIVVNDEYGALEDLLDQAYKILAPGGRIAIISFHSGEDRIVKHVFRKWAEDEIDDITGQVARASGWDLLSRKPVVPTEDEIERNPRSRSAKLRIIKKSDEA